MEDDPRFQIGELFAKVDMINDKVDKLQVDMDEFKAQRSHLFGIGASVSFFIACVGFLFGDGVRNIIKRGLGN
jgi:hypothetical protein